MLIDELAKAMYEANRVQVESSFPRPEWAYADHSSRAYWIRTATGTLPFIRRHIEARELAAVACVVDETERLGGATNPAADAQGDAVADALQWLRAALDCFPWSPDQRVAAEAAYIAAAAANVDSVNTSAATCIESGGKCADAQGVEALADDDAARKAYGEYTGNHPVMHCNRFPAWSELGDAEREKWREKARRLTAAGVNQKLTTDDGAQQPDANPMSYSDQQRVIDLTLSEAYRAGNDGSAFDMLSATQKINEAFAQKPTAERYAAHWKDLALKAADHAQGLQIERDAETKRADALAVRVKELEAERGEIVGYAPFGDGGYGKAVRISGYIGETEREVLGYVLVGARREGFKGTALERLAELRWEIRPLCGDKRLCDSILSGDAKGDCDG